MLPCLQAGPSCAFVTLSWNTGPSSPSRLTPGVRSGLLAALAAAAGVPAAAASLECVQLPRRSAETGLRVRARVLLQDSSLSHEACLPGAAAEGAGSCKAPQLNAAALQSAAEQAGLAGEVVKLLGSCSVEVAWQQQQQQPPERAASGVEDGSSLIRQGGSTDSSSADSSSSSSSSSSGGAVVPVADEPEPDAEQLPYATYCLVTAEGRPLERPDKHPFCMSRVVFSAAERGGEEVWVQLADGSCRCERLHVGGGGGQAKSFVILRSPACATALKLWLAAIRWCPG